MTAKQQRTVHVQLTAVSWSREERYSWLLYSSCCKPFSPRNSSSNSTVVAQHDTSARTGRQLSAARQTRCSFTPENTPSIMCDLYVSLSLLNSLAQGVRKTFVIGNREPLSRKLTPTVRHRKVFRVVGPANSPRALVAPPSWLSGGSGLLFLQTRAPACRLGFGRLASQKTC